jgi:hypothetical protein
VAITPTVMIAAQGMLSGGGIGANSGTSDHINSALSDPLVSAYLSVSSNANVGNVSGLSSTLSSLPSAITSVTSTTSQIVSQSALMAPDIKTFINLHSGAAAFGSASAEYGAALSQFGNKTFADLGVGVKSFVDANSGGLTSILPGVGALAAAAKKDAFGSIGVNLDPTALAKGTAQLASSALSDGLKSVGVGLKNFGTLFDFKNPMSLGYKGMIANLQKQGLADSTGITDGINAANYDPKNLNSIPDSVLHNILSAVTGNDLEKIIKQTGVKPVGKINTAADLVDPSNLMPAGAVAALGLKPGTGIAGLKNLGNTMTNIGIPMDNVSAAKLLGGVQTKVGSYLSGLTSLVPASVSATLGSFLGSGSSPFGTPTMSDMLGSLSGVHNNDLGNINKQFTNLSSSSSGLALTVALQTMNTALTANIGTDTAYTALQSAVTNFNAQAVGNSGMAAALASVGASTNNISGHLSKELSNFSLGGITLSSPPPTLPGSGQILSFASKLHGFGVDKLQLGHNDIFNGAATNDLTGDAIKAALLEGKNVSAMSGAGKAPISVSNQTKALSDANSANMDNFISDYNAAQSALQESKTASDAAKVAFYDIDARYRPNPNDEGLRALWLAAKADYGAALDAKVKAAEAVHSAEDKMISAANSAGGSAMSKAFAARDKYVS